MAPKIFKYALLFAATTLGFAAYPAAAQSEADRADPALVDQELGARLPSASSVLGATAMPGHSGSTPVASAAIFVPVGAVRVDGAPSFRAGDFASAVEPFLGRRLGPDELRALARAVADVARARGLVFATAYVPAQAVTSGVVRVRLDEGRIDEVRLPVTASPATRRALGGLSDGRPVMRAQLERALLIAGDLPGARIAGSRFRREGPASILDVDAREEPIAARVQIDNWGSSSVGPIRVRVRGDANGAFLSGDQLSIRGTLTPFQPRELATVGADYAVPIGADGLLGGLGASWTRVRPGGRTDDDRIDGRSASFNANLSYPVVRTQDASLWATADFTLRDVEQDRAGETSRSDRLSTVTLGVSGVRRSFGGWAYARLAARQGLSAFDATRRGDPLASRDGAGAVFTKVDAYADWTGTLSGPIGLRVAAEGQVSTRALLSSEEMGIGGPRFGRAYDYSERSGDRGIAGLAELRFDLKKFPGVGRSTQLYMFGDAASVGNKGRGRGGSLYSAGAGARVDLSRKLDAGVEVGFPIGHDRFETGDRDPRLSFTLSARL